MRMLWLLLVAMSASAQYPTQRIDDLPGRKIQITAVEFQVAPHFTCEVFYWFPQDANQDGQIESCRNLEYNPCDPLSGQLELIRYVTSGGSCDPLPPPLECDFSPLPPGCR